MFAAIVVFHMIAEVALATGQPLATFVGVEDFETLQDCNAQLNERRAEFVAGVRQYVEPHLKKGTEYTISIECKEDSPKGTDI